MRRKPKIDANQPEIVAALRAVGASVWPVNDRVDLIVGYNGKNYLMEVKDPAQPRSAHKERRERQQKFREEWQGQCVQVETIEQALATLRG